MDDRLQRALNFSNYRQTLHIQKQNLQQRMKNQLQVMQGPGMFLADQQMISFVKTLIDKEWTEAVLIDSKQTPVKVDDLEEFLDKLIDAYFKATNEYYVASERLKRSRNIEALLEWNPKQDDEEQESAK